MQCKCEDNHEEEKKGGDAVTGDTIAIVRNAKGGEFF